MADESSLGTEFKEDDELDELLDSELFPCTFVALDRFLCPFAILIEIQCPYCCRELLVTRNYNFSNL